MDRSPRSTRSRPARVGGAVVGLLMLVWSSASACGRGGVGDQCALDQECGDAFCCGSDACAGGFCTYDCKHDSDCPPDMGCDHDLCFFRCQSNEDCPLPFNCVKGNTLCEAS